MRKPNVIVSTKHKAIVATIEQITK